MRCPQGERYPALCRVSTALFLFRDGYGNARIRSACAPRHRESDRCNTPQEPPFQFLRKDGIFYAGRSGSVLSFPPARSQSAFSLRNLPAHCSSLRRVPAKQPDSPHKNLQQPEETGTDKIAISYFSPLFYDQSASGQFT